MQGWIILLEEMPLKPQFGTVRVMAPLAGCNVSIMIFSKRKYTLQYCYAVMH